MAQHSHLTETYSASTHWADGISRGPAKYGRAFSFDHADSSEVLQIVIISSTIRISREIPTMSPQYWKTLAVSRTSCPTRNCWLRIAKVDFVLPRLAKGSSGLAFSAIFKPDLRQHHNNFVAWAKAQKPLSVGESSIIDWPVVTAVWHRLRRA